MAISSERISQESPTESPDVDPLEGLALLAALSAPLRAVVRDAFTRERYEFGETVVAQGEEPDAYYVVVRGSARVLTVGDDGEEVSLNRLTPGDAFGEAALVANAPRSATVRASAPLELLRLDKGIFLALVKHHPELEQAFALEAQARRLGDFLRIHTLFSTLPRDAVFDLIDELAEVRVAEGEVIVREGDTADAVFLVEDGSLAVEAGNERLRVLHTPDFFGELAIHRRMRRTATVRALEPTLLRRLDAEVFRRLVAEHPEFERRIEERIALYERRTKLGEFQTHPERAGPGAERDVGFAAVEEHDELATLAATETLDRDSARHRPRFRQRFPLVRQIDEMDCGAACVSMIARHYGHDVSRTYVRQALGTGTDGTSLRAIVRGGQEVGISFRPLKSSIDRLAALPLPAVIHWDGNHWVVLHEVAKDRVRVADPARGRRSWSLPEFAEHWTGYAALPEPTERLAEAPRGGLDLSWLSPFVRSHRRGFAGAVALAAVAAGLQMLLPVFTQIIVDRAVHARRYDLLNMLALAMLGVLVLAVGATLLQRRLLSRMAVQIDGDTLDFLTARLLALPLAYFETRRSADIERRLNGLRQVRRILVQQGVNALSATARLLVTVVIMFVYSWQMALLFLVTMPLYALLMRYSRSRLQPTFESLEEAFARHQARQMDSIKGIETVKSLGAEPGLRRTMLIDFRGLQEKLFRADYTIMAYDALVQLTGFAIFVAFVWLGALLVLNGTLSVGEFVSFNALILLANGPIMVVLGLWDELQLGSVLLARLQDVFEHQPEQAPDEHELQTVERLEGHVRLRRLGFAYASDPDRPILHEVSLDVPPGTTVALVGRSGSGKSTLVKCLAGLLVPTHGAVEYDGTDLRHLRFADLRRRIGFVLQEPYLFDDTIAGNVALGEEQPDSARVRWAAEIANASEFIERLPLGYQTRIGDSGLRLSGGQAQRVAIARALYHQPPVLIFDEATSALDTEAERAVKEAMDRLLVGRTAFVIAHRLSTIRDADIICVLDNGRLVEQGTHEQLIRRQGLYAYLHAQQLEG